MFNTGFSGLTALAWTLAIDKGQQVRSGPDQPPRRARGQLQATAVVAGLPPGMAAVTASEGLAQLAGQADPKENLGFEALPVSNEAAHATWWRAGRRKHC